MNPYNRLEIMTIVMNTTNILYKFQLGSDKHYSCFVQFSRQCRDKKLTMTVRNFTFLA